MVERAFRRLPDRYLGAEPGFDATYHVRLGDVGHTWEVRNRVTLCRCGHSGNKPFCDGTHSAVGFRDRAPATTEPSAT